MSDTEVKLMFEEWVTRGYPFSPQIEEPPAPCIVCGAPLNTCTGEQHGESP